ncbi:MAG: hypothetical protein BWY29_00456 [Microgenomates group bacterium ADurb.Bin238]|nr:MAG: hypothetical protein BWY29_00456 [Microgenomates group bacterium ADurb.Bin238]
MVLVVATPINVLIVYNEINNPGVATGIIIVVEIGRPVIGTGIIGVIVFSTILVIPGALSFNKISTTGDERQTVFPVGVIGIKRNGLIRILIGWMDNNLPAL